MLKGQIFITNDLNIVMNSLYNNKIITIGEKDDELIKNTGAVSASIFLPPYQAVSLFVDGDMSGFAQCYSEYLSTKEPSEFIALIIKCLVDGVNILLYLTKDESEMGYANVLLNYLLMNFGVCVGTPNNGFSYNPTYNSRICDILYYYGFITTEELFINYTDPMLNPMIIPILIKDIQPYMGNNQNPTLDDYSMYFNHYLEMVRNNNNRFLVNPISKG